MSRLLYLAGLFSTIIAAASLLNDSMFANLWLCYVLFYAVGALALATAGLLVAGEIGLASAFTFLTIQAVSVVLTAASIYNGYGYLEPGCIESSGQQGLYFSIVTWTTLGYGDYQPKPELRLVAASQAVFGYLFLGLIVGSVSNLLGRSHRGGRIDRE